MNYSILRTRLHECFCRVSLQIQTVFAKHNLTYWFKWIIYKNRAFFGYPYMRIGVGFFYKIIRTPKIQKV